MVVVVVVVCFLSLLADKSGRELVLGVAGPFFYIVRIVAMNHKDKAPVCWSVGWSVKREVRGLLSYVKSRLGLPLVGPASCRVGAPVGSGVDLCWRPLLFLSGSLSVNKTIFEIVVDWFCAPSNYLSGYLY